MFWGVKTINNEKVGKWDPAVLGELEWDDSFKFAPADSQKELIYFCNNLKEQDFVLNKDVFCWYTDQFMTWLRKPSEEAILKKADDKNY